MIALGRLHELHIAPMHLFMWQCDIVWGARYIMDYFDVLGALDDDAPDDASGSSAMLTVREVIHSCMRFPIAAQIPKEVAVPPEKLNKTRGIGVINAPPELVAGVITDEYEAWDSTIRELRVLSTERDPASGALVDVCWSRYCLRARANKFPPCSGPQLRLHV